MFSEHIAHTFTRGFSSTPACIGSSALRGDLARTAEDPHAENRDKSRKDTISPDAKTEATLLYTAYTPHFRRCGRVKFDSPALFSSAAWGKRLKVSAACTLPGTFDSRRCHEGYIARGSIARPPVIIVISFRAVCISHRFLSVPPRGPRGSAPFHMRI